MKNSLLAIAIIFLCFYTSSCKTSNEINEQPSSTEFLNQVTDSEFDSLALMWRNDSLGCLKLRNPRMAQMLIEHNELMGKDSIMIVRYLGLPNLVHIQENSRKAFIYALECFDNGSTSYHNFYCHFVNDTLWQYSASMH